MDNPGLKQKIAAIFPEVLFGENKQYTEVIVPVEKWHSFCETLKSDPELHFDYLISITAVDWNDHFMMVCHLTSSKFGNVLVLKTRIDDRLKPALETVSDIWKTAEFHECEIFDLFGIDFKKHPGMRRLFLEDDYGFPLRKDFTDESRMIVK
jgi:NADH:ubiquinone oxidoreductase subunit C